jgi:hypothetical protein
MTYDTHGVGIGKQGRPVSDEDRPVSTRPGSVGSASGISRRTDGVVQSVDRMFIFAGYPLTHPAVDTAGGSSWADIERRWRAVIDAFVTRLGKRLE